MNITEIMRILKHRYPFLLVDRVLDIKQGERIVGMKNVTINEPFFSGHFPDRPIMPGVLIIESIAQLTGLLMGENTTQHGFLTSVYSARFFEPVIPGDTLVISSEITQKVKNLVRIKGEAKVNDKRVAKVELGFVVMEITNADV